MELPLRAALIGWLAGDAALAGQLNAITEEGPAFTSLPWLAISASASVDWSTKTETGYESRIAFELHVRADQPGNAAPLVAAIQAALAAMPRAQAGFTIIGLQFMRQRAEQLTETTRTVLLEYRFRTIAG
ncbi:MAG TPA: DUF3168 domain-containing protein [Novosphingobium sp.]|nr:DUF3168 domain-containing protein [Novosphingobium sp.]